MRLHCCGMLTLPATLILTLSRPWWGLPGAVPNIPRGPLIAIVGCSCSGPPVIPKPMRPDEAVLQSFHPNQLCSGVAVSQIGDWGCPGPRIAVWQRNLPGTNYVAGQSDAYIHAAHIGLCSHASMALWTVARLNM